MNTTRLRSAVLALIATAALAACGSSGDAGTSADEPASQAPAEDATGGGTLALTADGSTAGKCAVPNAQTLATFDTAFAGTVTALDGGTATLSVDQWYAGDEASKVTVEAPSKDLQDLLMAVDFQPGKSYLVSAKGDRVTLCGFTAEKTPELEAIYSEAFAS